MKHQILLLTHRVPHPPNRGDRIRSHHLLKCLSARADVHLACLADEAVASESRAWLDHHCVGVAVEPLGKCSRWSRATLSAMRGRTVTEGLFRSPRLKRTVRRWAREKRFDVVVVFCSSMWQYSEIPELSDAPVVADLVDVDSQKWFDYAQGTFGWRRWLCQLEGRRVRQLEGRIVRRAKAITLVSDAEAELFRSLWPNDKTIGVPNGVDMEYFNPDAVEPVDESYDCVFVGQLDYRPNVEGVRWFCQHVWPAIVRERPGATFAIVGRRPVAEVRKLAELTGVKLIGEVADVRPYLAAAKIAVAPLQIARGIQNKVLEAMAMGVPVVASLCAMTGLNIAQDDHTVCTVAPSEWISALLELLPDVARCKQLAERGRAFVVRRHSWQSCLAPLAELTGQQVVGDAICLTSLPSSHASTSTPMGSK